MLRTALDAMADPGEFPKEYLTPQRGCEQACPCCGGPLEKVSVSGRNGDACPRCQKGK